MKPQVILLCIINGKNSSLDHVRKPIWWDWLPQKQSQGKERKRLTCRATKRCLRSRARFPSWYHRDGSRKSSSVASAKCFNASSFVASCSRSIDAKFFRVEYFRCARSLLIVASSYELVHRFRVEHLPLERAMVKQASLDRCCELLPSFPEIARELRGCILAQVVTLETPWGTRAEDHELACYHCSHH